MLKTTTARTGAALALAAFAGLASGQITLVTDARLVSGNVATPDENDADALTPTMFGAALDDNIQLSALGNGAAAASGSQTSNIGADRIVGRGGASLSLNPASVGSFASIFEIVFTLDSNALASLSVAASASGEADAAFILSRQGQGTVASGPGVFDLDLEAGTYAIRAVAQSIADASQASAPTGGAASFVFDLTIIPAPGAAGLLAGAGLFAARRRRA